MKLARVVVLRASPYLLLLLLVGSPGLRLFRGPARHLRAERQFYLKTSGALGVGKWGKEKRSLKMPSASARTAHLEERLDGSAPSFFALTFALPPKRSNFFASR